MSKLVGALLDELADDVPNEPYLETVKNDLTAARSVYESGKKKDLALRFYLAIRSLLHEVERLEEELKEAKSRTVPAMDSPIGNQAPSFDGSQFQN